MRVKFVQITTSNRTLFALGDDNVVYRYISAKDDPATGKTRYAFWSPLTTFTPERPNED